MIKRNPPEKLSFKKSIIKGARCWCCVLVISGTWEAETKGSGLQVSPVKNLQNLISTKKSWVWWCVPIIPATARSINRRIMVLVSIGKKMIT
jgi:hypothetical protein